MENKKENIIHFIKASISSIISACVDLGLFSLICHNNNAFLIIMIGTVVARVVSAIINFIINKYWAFQSKGRTTKEATLFFILFILKMLISSLLVWLLIKKIHLNKTIIKSIIDILLFFVSYIIQKKFIFNKTSN